MKYIFVLIISILSTCLCSCTIDKRDTSYQINSSYTYKRNNIDITYECYIEKNESRFVWNFIAPNNETEYFYFIFNSNTLELENSEEFDYYTSMNNKIEFNYEDSTGLNKYEFLGTITIYIYYNNASIEVINAINNNTYDLEIANVRWFSKPELFY